MTPTALRAEYEAGATVRDMKWPQRITTTITGDLNA